MQFSNINDKDFIRQINAEAKRINNEAGKLVRRVVLDLATTVTLNTPVLTGRLRGNWQTTVGSPSLANFPDRFDKSGRETIQQMNRAISAQRTNPFVLYWITNNTEYVLPVEFGGPVNTPRLMLTRAVDHMETKYAGIFRRL